MGMSEAEFYQTTPRYFHHRLKGWRRNNEKEEAWHRWHLELHRASLSYLYNVQLDKVHRQKPQSLFPLPWDEKPKEHRPEDVRKWVEDKGYSEIPIDQF